MKGILLSIITIAVLCSCEHREINTYTDTEVVFDWKNLMTGDAKSTAMELHYYNKETGEHIVVNGNQDGSKQFIPYGTYQLLVFSSSVKNVEYKGLNNYHTAEIYAKKSSTITKASLDTVLLQPGSIYAAKKEAIILKPVSEASNFITLEPYIKVIKVNINFSGDTSQINNYNVSLSGIASGINLATGNSLSDTTNANYNVNSGQVQMPTHKSQDLTLSFLGIANTKNIMTIGVTLSDSTVLSASADVTDALCSINIKPVIKIDTKIDISPIGLKATITDWKVSTGSGTVGGK
ncbi:MAG: DUF5119 domain-containing protein [Bacteroidales bacterium]